MGLTTTRSLAQNSYRMNFVVNRELRMGTGKTAAQVAHACLSLYTQLTGNSNLRTHYNAWLLTGQTKVVLQCDTTDELLALYQEGRGREIVCCVVRDAGRTQVATGTCTVLGVFGDGSQLMELTGHLKLL